MGYLLIILCLGLIIFFSFLKYNESLISKKIDQRTKYENQSYIKLGIDSTKESPYQIQQKIDLIKSNIGCTDELNINKNLIEYKEFEALRNKGLLLVRSDLAEICSSCGTLKTIDFLIKGSEYEEPGCYKCTVFYEMINETKETAYHMIWSEERQSKMENTIEFIHKYTGSFNKLELPKTHPSSPEYSYFSESSDVEKNLDDQEKLLSYYDDYESFKHDFFSFIINFKMLNTQSDLN
tara:strand:+ start:41 stop:751 length:711 start_codon:yes stop_codon:yes gene_type:complete